MNVFLASVEERSDVVEAILQVYLAGENYKNNIIENMQVYLAGEHEVKNGSCCSSWKGLNILESFYYARKNKYFEKLLPCVENLLIDSGAFTFLAGHRENIDWEKYVEEYAAFVNRYDIKLFFELDIDSIVGLNKVTELRNRLETLTGKKPIPVWHRNRGKEYFIKMCENYPYVALGGIVTKEIDRKKYETAFPWFIKTAHDHKCKIHGLGYTTVANLKKYHFDSVDSTAWLYGNRGGYLYKFNPATGLMAQISKEGCRVKSRECALHNFNEWIKYTKWANIYL